MLVYEITAPGTWLDYEDPEWARKIKAMLESLESLFFEANSALNLFQSQQSERLVMPDRASWLRDRDRRAEIEQAVTQERGVQLSAANFDEINFEVDVRFKREKWTSGKTPRELEHNVSFIYARAFLYALDGFDKFLKVLADEPGVPQQIAECHAQMRIDFPHLRGVRNTVQHLEDRSRGLGAGRPPAPLNLQPVTAGGIQSPNGTLILNNLHGSRFGSTMADGHFGEVDVSPESMQKLQVILERVLNAFQWKGQRRHRPGA